MTHKPRLSFWQVWNMSFGFLGIQFGWALQLANMSAIYEYLGAKPDEIPILWLAAPLTGLLVQPFIGHLSDRTWGPLGRRRPYFLVGAILSSIALVLMPNSSTLWIAAGLLWILDASINISMEPFRAFVADLLPDEQRTLGFTMQSFFIGVGATVASALPFLFSNWLGIGPSAPRTIPETVRLSFYCGAVAFLAAVLWTVLRTKEYPPEDMTAFQRMKATGGGFSGILREIGDAIAHMPSTMKQLAVVQVATWLGLFCMWMFFGPTVSRQVFGAVDSTSPGYTAGVEWGGICFMAYSIVCFLVAPLLRQVSDSIGRRATHSIALLCGAAGLVSVLFIETKWPLLLSMAGVGIAWASILSMPYVMLSSALPPHRVGVYMGVFNFFIVIPEIVAALSFGWVMNNVFGNQPVYAVVAGGVFMALAALLTQRVREAGETAGATLPRGAAPAAT